MAFLCKFVILIFQAYYRQLKTNNRLENIPGFSKEICVILSFQVSLETLPFRFLQKVGNLEITSPLGSGTSKLKDRNTMNLIRLYLTAVVVIIYSLTAMTTVLAYISPYAPPDIPEMEKRIPEPGNFFSNIQTK